MSKQHKNLALTVILVVGLLLTGCSKATAPKPSKAPAPATATDTANVAYAGSLQLVNDQYLGPAFRKATGLNYQGRGGGAFGVANQIAAGEIKPNVFESMGTAPIQTLSPKFTDWAVGFASSPLCIAYSPKSQYASEFNAIAKGQKPLADLFTLMKKPGFHLGRTNPETDPQGQVFVMMMHLAQQQLNLPAGTADAILGGQDNPKQIFAEESILSQLQAGQLDASSAYLSEAVQRHLPYISLPSSINFGDPSKNNVYATQSVTLKNGKKVAGSVMEVYVTTIKGTPDQNAGVKFISYLLSSAGKQIYMKQGLVITPTQIWGNQKDIPSEILKATKS